MRGRQGGRRVAGRKKGWQLTFEMMIAQANILPHPQLLHPIHHRPTKSGKQERAEMGCTGSAVPRGTRAKLAALGAGEQPLAIISPTKHLGFRKLTLAPQGLCFGLEV